MTTFFKGREINLKAVTSVGPVQTDRFNVYANTTYSFTVHFKSEYIHGVPVREPVHFCSHDQHALNMDREELQLKIDTWRIH